MTPTNLIKGELFKVKFVVCTGVYHVIATVYGGYMLCEFQFYYKGSCPESGNHFLPVYLVAVF